MCKWSSNAMGARGFTVRELVVLLACVMLVTAMVIPVTASSRRGSGVAVSRHNLIVLGAAQAVYAADWNGRQVQFTDEGLSALGDEPWVAFNQYEALFGELHPPAILGWGRVGQGPLFLYAYRTSSPANQVSSQPIAFTLPTHLTGYGAFRLCNARPLHDYVSGRFYDPVFYAPNDVTAYGFSEPHFDDPHEFVRVMSTGIGDLPYWSSYATSPAALFHPEVMRAESAGGWQDPWSIDTAFEAPGLFAAKYPSLKTQMIEHHWNQSAPTDLCNPDFVYPVFGGCEPYYFNHGAASEPVALFYDLTVRLLANAEARAADAAVIKATGEGLWSRDTAFGEVGYFGDIAFDEDYFQSHHILTTDGIRGRDTVEGAQSVKALSAGH